MNYRKGIFLSISFTAVGNRILKATVFPSGTGQVLSQKHAPSFLLMQIPEFWAMEISDGTFAVRAWREAQLGSGNI